MKRHQHIVLIGAVCFLAGCVRERKDGVSFSPQASAESQKSPNGRVEIELSPSHRISEKSLSRADQNREIPGTASSMTNAGTAVRTDIDVSQVIKLGTNHTAAIGGGWTKDLHQNQGNLALGDGPTPSGVYPADVHTHKAIQRFQNAVESSQKTAPVGPTPVLYPVPGPPKDP